MFIKSCSFSLQISRKIHLVDTVVGVHFQMDTYGHEGTVLHELRWKFGWKDNRYPGYMVQLDQSNLKMHSNILQYKDGSLEEIFLLF